MKPVRTGRHLLNWVRLGIINKKKSAYLRGREGGRAQPKFPPVNLPPKLVSLDVMPALLNRDANASSPARQPLLGLIGDAGPMAMNGWRWTWSALFAAKAGEQMLFKLIGEVAGVKLDRRNCLSAAFSNFHNFCQAVLSTRNIRFHIKTFYLCADQRWVSE